MKNALKYNRIGFRNIIRQLEVQLGAEKKHIYLINAYKVIGFQISLDSYFFQTLENLVSIELDIFFSINMVFEYQNVVNVARL